MTDQDVDEKTTHEDEEESEAEIREGSDLARVEESPAALESAVPTQLGATRHVLAGFFAAGIAVAFLVSKVLSGTWNRLADNPWVAVIVGALLVLNRLVWIDLLELRLTGRQLNVDSSLLLVFLAYWGWTWGIVGLLLAVPMLTSLKIVLANISDTWPLARLMSEE